MVMTSIYLCHNVAEIILKLALNTNQSIDRSIYRYTCMC